MNPIFPRIEYFEKKKKLPGWKFRMFYDGEFTRPAGMIYHDFTELHKIKRFEIPVRWPKYFMLDPGGVNLAKGWIAEDPASGNLYLYRATLSGGKTTREHVKEVLDFGEVIVGAWGGSSSEGQIRRDWTDAGLYISEPPISDVESGIDRVIEVLKSRRFYVFDDLAEVIDEFGTYSRKLNEMGEPTEEIKDKNTFHLLDMIRYGIAGIVEGQTAGGNYQTKYA
jgi:hypothetical protein